MTCHLPNALYILTNEQSGGNYGISSSESKKCTCIKGNGNVNTLIDAIDMCDCPRVQQLMIRTQHSMRDVLDEDVIEQLGFHW